MKTNQITLVFLAVGLFFGVCAWAEACSLIPDTEIDGLKFRGGLSIACFLLAGILDCAFRELRGEPRRERELAEQYREHWLRNGIDPTTGQKLEA